HRGNIDDPSGLPGDHMGDSSPAAVKHGRKIGVDDPVPIFVRHIHKKSDVGDACIIDQDVHAFAHLGDLLKDISYAGGIAYVAGNNVAVCVAGFLDCAL